MKSPKVLDNKKHRVVGGIKYTKIGDDEYYAQELFESEELEKLVDIAKIQSTEASNAIEGIVTTNTRIRQLVGEKRLREIATNRR